MTAQEILNVLRAAVVADALGVPVEMKARGTFQLTGMTGHGSWDQPTGSWSDDSSMTLCLLTNINEQGSYADLMDKFERYMMTGAYTPTGTTFDVGRTCAHAVRQYAINHIEPLHCGDTAENANGNGALMRIAPLALVLKNEDNQDNRFAVIHNYTVVTHGHLRAIMGSFIYIELLRDLMMGMSLRQALSHVQEALITFVATHEKFASEAATYQRLFTPRFQQLPATAIRSTGYVVDTLEAAVWIALNHHDLATGILAAANLGSDSDTVATVAASLMAFERPQQSVPTDWWDQTLNHELLDHMMQPFAAKFGEEK